MRAVTIAYPVNPDVTVNVLLIHIARLSQLQLLAGIAQPPIVWAKNLILSDIGIPPKKGGWLLDNQ
jgi:hypothetical protein